MEGEKTNATHIMGNGQDDDAWGFRLYYPLDKKYIFYREQNMLYHTIHVPYLFKIQRESGKCPT